MLQRDVFFDATPKLLFKQDDLLDSDCKANHSELGCNDPDRDGTYTDPLLERFDTALEKLRRDSLNSLRMRDCITT